MVIFVNLNWLDFRPLPSPTSESIILVFWLCLIIISFAGIKKMWGLIQFSKVGGVFGMVSRVYASLIGVGILKVCLLSMLSNYFICRDKDVRIWSSALLRGFCVKSLVGCLSKSYCPPPQCASIWQGLASPQLLKVFTGQPFRVRPSLGATFSNARLFLRMWSSLALCAGCFGPCWSFFPSLPLFHVYLVLLFAIV